jgi:hypothetical protein
MNPEELKLLADAEFDRALHRQNIKETAHSQMTVAFAGGLFVANPSLIAYLSTETEETVYVEDIYGIPVEADRIKFLNAIKSVYQKTMKIWHKEYQSSNRIRKAQHV